MRNMLAIFVLVAMLGVSSSRADDPSWTTAATPFRIAGNLYYVGSEELAAYLVVTPQGDILINSNLESSPKQIRASVEKLGFRWSDVKILLISQGHFDHCAGSAALLKLTRAKYYVMDADVSVVEFGGKTDFAYANQPDMHFPPAKVDRILHDGSKVSLGGTTLTAHLTAGHNRGTTTWTLDETEFGPSGLPGAEGHRTLHAVIVGGPNVNSGYKLVGNAVYPSIASDYRSGFATLRSLPCDLFLGAHGGYFDLDAKLPRFLAGDRDAFIDPAGYKAYIDDRERAFQAELAHQQSGK